MHRNQHTSTGAAANLNVRISPSLRARLERVIEGTNISKADVVREALEHHLPTIEKDNTKCHS
jgi:predicted DNA-binding protein